MNKGRENEPRSARSGHRSPSFFGKGMVLKGLLTLFGLGALGVLALATSGVAAVPKDRGALERAVVGEMLDREGAQSFGPLSTAEGAKRTQTNVERVGANGTWAFGSAVILAPERKDAYPEGWLFVAERAGDGWEVGLEGTQTFAELAEDAPRTVVGEGEKKTFAANSNYSALSVSTGLRLPWTRRVSWTMTSGPHGWAGYDRPYSALDLAGGSGRVRAARGGRVYTMCGNSRGWIRVVHPNGYATDYYHLSQNIKPRDGKRIDTGTFLGLTGTDTSCGGRASGRHVHFALRRSGQYATLDRKTIGGWTFHTGRSYGGYAQHGDVKRHPGGLLRNFGS